MGTFVRGFVLLLSIIHLGGCATASVDVGDPAFSRDVIYGHKDGMALTYDVLHPESANGAGIIFMVSGGWFSSWQEPEKRVAGFSHYLDAGFTVFAVHHGSAPRFKVPDAVSDVRAAVRHIKVRSSGYGVDSERLGVFGGSAGGHLALMLGLAAEEGPDFAVSGAPTGRITNKYQVDAADDAKVAAVVAYFPPTDLRPIAGPNERFPALDFSAEKAAAVSPVLFVTRDDPPIKLIHGTADTLVPLSSSEIIKQRLLEIGVTHDLLVIEEGDHGFRNPVHRQAAAAASLAWFSEHLLGSGAE